MATNIVGSSGATGPHTNIQPYLTMLFIIALQGVFPSRN
jgi:microcystin-dependent protein